jgi:hypothetical protein
MLALASPGLLREVNHAEALDAISDTTGQSLVPELSAAPRGGRR